MFAEGIFDGETFVVRPEKPRSEMRIELRPVENDSIDIHVKASVGPPGAVLLQVFEMTRQLPRFCMYQVISRPSLIPKEILNNGLRIQVQKMLTMYR